MRIIDTMRPCFSYSRLLLIAGAILLAHTAQAGQAGNLPYSEKNNKDAGYKAGSLDKIGGWKAVDLEQARTVAQPLCLYIYDAEHTNNNHAKFFEGLSCLNNDDVQEKLKSFNCLKIKSNGSDAKGWPAEWLARAKAGCVLILASDDLKLIQIYDKNTVREQINGRNLTAVIDGILKYDEQKKAEANKDKAGEPKKKVLGF